MLSFSEFFDCCDGHWTIERTYHSLPTGEIERSHTEYWVTQLGDLEKQPLLSVTGGSVVFDRDQLLAEPTLMPGFAIRFDTVSEKGDRRSMSLKALFVPDAYLLMDTNLPMPSPIAALVSDDPEIITGYYLRDQGYEEAGAIAGRFTYHPSRHTLEMTTYYRQSVAVDQMRFLDETTRLRTITTYDRPAEAIAPTSLSLIGFGVEKRNRMAIG